MSGRRPAAIDLFCGAGGLSLGLERSGFDVIQAVDNNEYATKTYAHNLAGSIHTEDITSLKIEALDIQKDKIDLVAGGPPCPTFSRVGRTKINSIEARTPENDERHQLYEHFLRIVSEIEPVVILLENVPGMRSATNKRNQSVLKVIRDDMVDLGYDVTVQFPNAADFGVPQRRIRTIFIGNRLELENPDLDRWTSHREPETNSEREISFPGVLRRSDDIQSTLELFGIDKGETRPFPSYDVEVSWRNPWVTVGAAILDLPPLTPAGKNPTVEASEYQNPPSKVTEYLLEPFTSYQRWAREDTAQDSLENHQARDQNMNDLSLYKLLGEGVGWIIDDIDPNFQPYRRDVFPDNYRKQRATRPASTILAHISKDGHQYIHPREARSLTVREAARLQSFPDEFVFPVSRTQAYRQVGEAVPPLLGQAIGTAIKEKLL